MTVVELMYLAMTLLLVVAGIALLVPAIRGSQVILYRRAMFVLGVSTLIFVTGWLVNYARYQQGVSDPVAGWYLYLLSGTTHIYAVWLFSRDFIAFQGGEDITVEIDGQSGGFETNDGE